MQEKNIPLHKSQEYYPQVPRVLSTRLISVKAEVRCLPHPKSCLKFLNSVEEKLNVALLSKWPQLLGYQPLSL